MTFDSEEYWGLDEEVIGETASNDAGASDQSTRSLSEAVERRMDANNQFLKSRDWKVSFNPWRKNEDAKTTDGPGLITNSRRLSCLFSIWGKAMNTSDQMGQFLFSLPVWIHPDTTKFRATMKGFVICPREIYDGIKLDQEQLSAPSNIGKTVRVSAYLVSQWQPAPPVEGSDSSRDIFGQSQESWSTDDNPVHRIEVDVDRNVQSPYRATLLLEFHTNPNRESQSVSISRIVDTSVPETDKFKNHILNLSDTDNDLSAVEGFQDDITDDTHIRFSTEFGGSPVYQATRTSKTDHKIHVQLRDDNNRPAGFGAANTQYAFTAHFHNSIAPQGWTFECFSDKKTPARRYTPKTNQEMEANQPVSGNDISAHARNIDYNYRKPRLKSIGPDGDQVFLLNSEVPWDQGYSDVTHARWKTVNFGDASSSYSEASQIDRHTLRADKGACTYRVVTHYAPVSFWEVPGTVEPETGLDSNVDGHYGMAVGSAPPIDSVTIEAGVDIDFGYDIVQRGSSATNEVVSSATSTESNVPIFIANIRNRFPILRTVFEWFWTDPDGEDFTYAGDDFNETPNLTYREGWLDRMDLAQIVQKAEHEITLPAPDDPTVDHNRPFDLRQYLKSSSNITAQYEADNGDIISHPDDRIEMVTIQTAVFEEPG